MKRITLALPSPYVGLRPFFEREALLFFGRDAHVRDLLAKLERRQRFLAVLGASGTGKSSLVRAGLIPALRRGALPPRTSDAPESGAIDRWNTCIFTPGDSPLAQLAHALTEDERWCDGADRPLADASLTAQLGATPLALTTLYRQRAARFEGEALLLVVDQFEEIFRYRQRNPDEADSFVKLLLRSSTEDVPIYVAITMRSDFLGNAVAIHGLAEAINSGIYLTPRLGSEQIRSVITSPLSLVGGSIDPVLANRLLNTLAGEDELPVLEHALLRMWDRAKTEGRTSIEPADYAAICGPRDGVGEPALPLAIDNHASEIFDALSSTQQTVARQFFLALIERREGRDVRRPQTLGELVALAGESARDALMVVIDAYRAPGVGFVLPPATRMILEGDLVDISHESLIRRWRQLQDWLGAEAQDVAELKTWKQRAEARRGGGGWLDENDAARAASWRTRVTERGDPAPWAARHAGAGAYELVDAYLLDSQAQIDRSLLEHEALRSKAEEERIARFEVEARMQREAAERAAADQAKAEQETQRALATADKIRFRGRVAGVVGALALIASAVAVNAMIQAKKSETQAKASGLARVADALANDLPDTSILLALEALKLAPEQPLANAIVRGAEAAYPYRLALRGHEGGVTAVQFSPDGKTVLTADEGKTLRLWDTASGKPLHVLSGHGDAIMSAEFSPDGLTVLSSSADTTARLWDVASGPRLLPKQLQHDAPVASARFSPDGKTVLTASGRGAFVWDAATGEQLQRLAGDRLHGYPVSLARFSAKGERVVTASPDGTVVIWDLRSGRPVQQTPLRHAGAINEAAFSPDGRYLLTASSDNLAKLWVADRREPQPLPTTLSGHTAAVTHAAFSPNGKVLLTASNDGTARLWDAATGGELRVLSGHKGRVNSAVFCAAGTKVLTAGADKSIRLWDAQKGGEALRVLRGHEDGVQSALCSPDGTTLLSASGDGTARLWDAASGDSDFMMADHGGPVTSAQFSEDRKIIYTASRQVELETDGLNMAAVALPIPSKLQKSGIIGPNLPLEPKLIASKLIQAEVARRWDAGTGKEMSPRLPGQTATLDARFFASDADHAGPTPVARVLTAADDGQATVWDLAGVVPAVTLKGHWGKVKNAEFSSDGQTVLTAGDDGLAILWDIRTGNMRWRLPPLPSDGNEDPPLPALNSARLSADGKLLVTASDDNRARQWDVASQTASPSADDPHRQPVVSARFSPVAKTVLTASLDSTAHLWVSGEEKPRVLPAHAAQLNGARFSPDGKLALTYSDDGTARLWDAKSGAPQGVLSGHELPVKAAVFSRDGKTVLTAGNDNTARLWDVASARQLRVLQGHTDSVTVVRFSLDGAKLLTGSNDGTARLWSCRECGPIDDLVKAARERVGRPLSPDEKKQHGVP